MSSFRQGPEGRRFSVVTVVRNDVVGLRLTAQSLLRQQDSLFEWIIVDGLSADGTAEEAMRLGREQDIIVSEPDAGIYDGMNKGLRLARGGYVCFLNAGDQFADKDVLRDIDRTIRATSPQPEIFFGASTLAIVGGARFHRRTKNPYHYIRHGLPSLHQAIFINRILHLENQYSDEWSVCADYGAIASMISRGATISYSQRLVSINEIGGKSHSHVNGKQLDMEVNAIQRRFFHASFPERLLSQIRRAVARKVVTSLSR